VSIDEIRVAPAGALNSYSVGHAGAVLNALNTHHGKFSEAVANARQRVLSLEASCCAGSQIPCVLIK
jgi:hypothetical protein